MTDVTIKTLAAERQTSVERLVQQFADAGIRKSADDSVSAQEKQTLIDHLNQKNSGPDKLTLQRKTRSTLTFLVPVEKANRYKSKSARNAPL
ncbi:translation initiation factor IF2-alpha [Escherichia coli]|uniref:Translation initiation factor IF2-alpha n=1 Tax=Escherichia coli TaxID=562 RepID=A0A376Y207_ECOLX|nr:translation initiation factor IF2-alpha [Escherichia coli]